MGELARIKKLAITLAKEAGGYAAGRIKNVGKIYYKKTFNNLVTNVDRKCEKVIIRGIREVFPEHSILAEESGEANKEGDFKWLIDPLDGTTNYAHAFPFFCTSIAVMQKSSIKIGVVYDPSRDELFVAEEGKGAFLNNKRIRVSGKKKLEDSLIATGFAYNMETKLDNVCYFEKVLTHVQAIRRAGSAALDLSYVACGRFDGFWEMGLYPWDTAAGQIIVREAGGVVTSMNGGAFDIFQKNILATNGLIHKPLMKLLSK